MSGHSHWSGIKHRKAAQDAKKGVAFQKLVKDIIAAAKEGGGDPNASFRLKVTVERAKAGNVPVDNIGARHQARYRRTRRPDGRDIL
ncbi:MAG: hypothetical protein ACLUEQ_09995 [Cloacibacillus evryensis]